LGYKLAVVPFHSWSPDVYQGAPTPITAFISTASKAAGFLLLFRVLIEALPSMAGSPSFTAEELDFGGWTGVLALLTLLTVVLGNLMALPQTNARRLLAYSSIAHAGFVLLAILAWASPLNMDRSLGLSALLYYLVVYTLTNIGAFGGLAVVSMAVGGDDIRDLNGLAQRNLGLAVMMAIFVLSLAGVPPLSGFFAKFYVFMAGWQSQAYWLVIVAVITTLIALYYYLRLLKAMFITAPDYPEPVTTPPAINATLILAAALVIALGVFPNLALTVFDSVQAVAGT
jgi:NADH-quinone oxidoreductase subunit N